jgi:hypothetical protein
MDVWVEDNCSGGINLYVVMVDGRQYDSFISTDRLTHGQMVDVANGYEEALSSLSEPNGR